ncbi:MAG: DNA primase [Eubacteriales bacterium SKADARSKE-1]|nr:DNA primase [Eubacteriales bacterium SKADARSKE-1]
MNIFEEVKNQTDIVDVARHVGIIINRNGKAICPFHNDSTPSMSFKNNYFKCFSCDAHGDAIELISRLHNISAIEAVRTLDSMFNLNLNLDKKLKSSKKIIQIKKDNNLYVNFENWIYYATLVLTRYFRLLRDTEIIYKPKSSGESPHPIHEQNFNNDLFINARAGELLQSEELHPLYIESIHNIEKIGYWLDCLTFGTFKEKVEFFKRNREEVKKLPTNLSNQVPPSICEQNFNKGLDLNSRLPEKANYLTKSEKIAILKKLSSEESAELNILNEEKTDTNNPYKDALNAVLNLFNLAPPEISYPLLSFTYLAPLNHFLTSLGTSPSFSLFCKGETGSFKTVISMLYLSHFMEYSGMTESPPANFHSTSNAIEKMAFTLKDTLLLVDDYHPTTALDKKRMDSICQRLARGAGDHLARARMTSDIKLRASYTPRSLVIITGEDVPDIGQSGLSRFYFVDFKKGIIDKSKLTTVQNNAHLLNLAMQFYIEWLIKKSDTLCEWLREIFNDYKDYTNMNDCHARMIPMLSWLGLGISMFCSFMQENEIFTETEVDEFCNNAFGVFKSSCEEQSKLQKEETPTVIFLTVINELLASDKKNVQMVDTGTSAVAEKFLGYQDNDFIYFFPEITFSAVIEFLRRQDRVFPVSRTRLFNDLAKENLIIADKGRRTFSKRVNGKVQRFLAIRKEAFNLVGGEQNEVLDTKTMF